MKHIEAYLKEEIITRKKNITYNAEALGGMEHTFNFTCAATKVPAGDVVLTTGYDDEPDYTSTFLMTAKEALELAKLLTDAAYDAMKMKAINNEADSCDAKLSFLVLKNAIDTIKITRLVESFDKPYYIYKVEAIKDNKVLFSFDKAYNLSYFTRESQIQYWMDKLTDKGRIKLETTNFDLFEELEERKSFAVDEFSNTDFSTLDLRPTPIIKEDINDNDKIREFINKNK